MKIEELKTRYNKAQKAYYAGKQIMTDGEFDRLEERIRKLDPDWAALRATGSEKINKKSKVELAEFMPSLSKHYPHQVDGWLTKRKGPWLLMPKLDGSSVQATYKDGRLYQLVTRGNGIVGQDITFLAKFTTLPQVIKHKGLFRVRCEAMMSRKVWQDKYSKISENPRNLVAGILNRKLDKDSTDQLRDVNFVVLGVFGMKLQEGLSVALASGFEVIHHVRKVSTNAHYLSQLLDKRRTNYQYEIDGLVLAPANQVFEYKDAERPDWATAFKENLSDDDAPTVKVKQVIWQISHNGRWTPKVEIEPVRLDGVTITHATAHNARWLIDNGIGAGAKIKIVRSGGVIPKIVSVVRRAKPMMPEGNWEWRGKYLYRTVGASDVDLEVEIKRTERFLKTCGIEGVKYKTLLRMKMSIKEICEFSAAKQRSRKLESMGFGPTQTKNIVTQLDKLQQGVSLSQVLIGCGVFPMIIGERKLKQLTKEVPLHKLIKMKGSEIREAISGLHGVADATADMFVRGILEFKPVLKGIKNYIVVNNDAVTAEPKAGKYSGQGATWTGYRSKEEEAEWVANGGEVVPFGGRTTVLFYKEGGKSSSKLDKAKTKGINVSTWKGYVKH